jgi:uncharacterized protein (TIGR02265 family)
VKIKGQILGARRDFVQEHFRDSGWEKVLSALPEADRQPLRGTILATAWYEFELGKRLDKAIVDVLGNGSSAVFEELGVKSARKNLNGVHKSFLSPGDPQTFMNKAANIYRYYYDTGRREYEETGPLSGVITTFEAETFSLPDCLTVIGWYKEALRMCGAKEVSAAEEECRANGGTCCRYRFEWKM